ncbi:MAG TPA: hypothetical protein VMM78_08695 [Thermomicrobiales bacterium]|nr:hypothetical protein [Thermomicrobiales bacterium]
MAAVRDNVLFREAGAAQAVYYVATGEWSLVHRRSFEAITGPKIDYWLVRTVGVLVMAAGASIGIAAGLAAIGAVYPIRGRISKIYLLDVVAEAALIAMWVKALARRR